MCIPQILFTLTQLTTSLVKFDNLKFPFVMSELVQEIIR
jgi:hypothetical protein